MYIRTYMCVYTYIYIYIYNSMIIITNTTTIIIIITIIWRSSRSWRRASSPPRGTAPRPAPCCSSARPSFSQRGGKCSSGGSALNNICWSSVKTLLVKCPSVQWQPDGLSIHIKKWFLGAGFPGAPPISLIQRPEGGSWPSSTSSETWFGCAT